MVRNGLRSGLAALALLALTPATGSAQFAKPPVGLDGHQHDSVYVQCTSTSAAYCYFYVLRAKGGVALAKVPHGQAMTLNDLEIGKDYFTVMLDQPPPTSLSLCRAMATDAAPCRWGVLKGSINDSGNRGG